MVVLNVFALAVILGVAFLTVTLTSLVDLSCVLLPLNVILAVYALGARPLVETLT